MLGVGPRCVSERYAEVRQRRRGALSGPPEGRHAFRPPSASLLLADSLKSTRRRSLMAGENRVVAGSLGFSEAPSSLTSKVSASIESLIATAGVRNGKISR